MDNDIARYSMNMRELAGLISRLPLSERVRAGDLLIQISGHQNARAKEHAATMIWISRNTSQLRQKADGYLSILNQVLAVCGGFGDEETQKLWPHVLTLKRFIEEHNAPEFTMGEAREELALELPERVAAIRAARQ